MQRSPAINIILSPIGLVLLGLFIITQPCQAQTASVETSEAKGQISKSIGNFKLTVPSLKDAAGTPAAPGGNPVPAGGGGAPQLGGVANLSDRVKSRDRLAPRRYDLKAIKAIKFVNVVLGGFDSGAGFGGGLELTTDDLFPLVEVYARAIGTTLAYHQGEAGVIIGNEKTRGNVYFNYTRREQDRIFGSLVQPTNSVLA